MIEAYFEEIESIISFFKNIRSYDLNKKVYSEKKGLIRGKIVFEDESCLYFTEVKDVDLSEKIKYRYQYMNKDENLVFRYDNSPHHKSIKTFPHHKHLDKRIVESNEVNLGLVLLEILRVPIRKSSKGGIKDFFEIVKYWQSSKS